VVHPVKRTVIWVEVEKTAGIFIFMFMVTLELSLEWVCESEESMYHSVYAPIVKA